MNYQALKAQVLQQIKEEQQGSGKKPGAQSTQLTLQTVTTTIQDLELTPDQLTQAVATQMTRDILSEQGVSQADIDRALAA